MDTPLLFPLSFYPIIHLLPIFKEDWPPFSFASPFGFSLAPAQREGRGPASREKGDGAFLFLSKALLLILQSV